MWWNYDTLANILALYPDGGPNADSFIAELVDLARQEAGLVHLVCEFLSLQQRNSPSLKAGARPTSRLNRPLWASSGGRAREQHR